jgi:hypothetical protein
MKSRTFLFCASCVLLVVQSTSSQEPARQTELFPLNVGTERTYVVKDPKGKGDNKVTIKVAKTETVEIKRMEPDPDDKEKKKLREVKVKVPAYLLETTSADRTPQTETVAVLEDGVYRVAALGKEIHPPLCFLKPKPGLTWKVDSMMDSQAIQGTFQTKEETVVWNKRNVTALKSYSNDFQIGKHRMEVEYWFVPMTGLLMQRVKVGGYDIFMELVPGKN